MDATASETPPALQRDSQHARAKLRNARCRNCGSVETALFCAECGQTTALHPPTVREFIHEFVGHYIALEGSLWRTLVALLFKPGHLTLEYFACRRARYIQPLRLYLTFSLILFAIGMAGGDLRIGNESIQFRTPQEAGVTDPVAGLIAGGRSTGVASFDRAIARVDALTHEQRTARINAGVRQFLPYVLIVLVPVLALYLKLLYWNRHRLYGEHLVVAFHAQTVAFIFALVSAIPLGRAYGDAVLLLLVAHGAIALRRVYGGRFWRTSAREAVLLFGYGITVTLALALLATIALVASA